MFTVGFRTAAFDDLKSAARSLGRMGYDCVELCLEAFADDLDAGFTARRAWEIIDDIEVGGLRIGSVSYHGDADDWEAKKRRQLSAIACARLFNTKKVVVNAPAEGAVSWDDLVAHFKDVAQAAEEQRVLVAIEPEPGTAIPGADAACKLLDTIGSQALGVNFDVGHMALSDGDAAAAAEKLEDRIFHVHFEDIPTGEHKHLVPGDGSLPLVDIMLAVWKAGFRGPLVIDLFEKRDDILEIAQRALRATRDMIREAMRRGRESGVLTAAV